MGNKSRTVVIGIKEFAQSGNGIGRRGLAQAMPNAIDPQSHAVTWQDRLEVIYVARQIFAQTAIRGKTGNERIEADPCIPCSVIGLLLLQSFQLH